MFDSSIQNLDLYNDRMKKSLLDKIFFIDKIDSQIFLDFGCADGSLISFLKIMFPNYIYFGYDISPDMIIKAKENNPEIAENFSSSWNEIEKKIDPKNTAVILSSIIHEVYSYGTSVDVETFWNRIYKSNFKYIIIRDMIPSHKIDHVSDINDISKIYRKANTKNLSSFESHWGSIENNKNLIHFLLKYKYVENWDREVKENYLSITREEILSNISDKYEITFHEHFILPYLKDTVKNDFGIEIKDNTHLKLILRKI